MGINTKELLDREEIVLNDDNIRKQIHNKRILVTGAAGSIGKKLLEQIVSYKPAHLCLIDHSEIGIFKLRNTYGGFENISIELGSITNQDKMLLIFRTVNPQIVFHTAAYKHVSLLECYPDESIRNNLIGTKIVADLAKKFQAEKFIFISTDKAVSPVCVMGYTKRLAEFYVLSLNSNDLLSTQFIITRFGNVIGSRGSVYSIFKRQIKNKINLTVTDPEATRYFMTLFEASQLVLKAAAMGRGGEVLVFNMGQPVLILDLAKRMIRLKGLIPYQDIFIIFTGLQSGEKLHEDLFHKDEIVLPSFHPGINIVCFPATFSIGIDNIISSLEEAIKTAKPEQLIKMLRDSLKETTIHKAKPVSLDS